MTFSCHYSVLIKIFIIQIGIKSGILTVINDLTSYFINKNWFTIFYLNIRSITQKSSLLFLMLNNKLHFIDCIELTECWLKNCIINYDIGAFSFHNTKNKQKMYSKIVV